jgi:hypothetical protein
LWGYEETTYPREEAYISPSGTIRLSGTLEIKNAGRVRYFGVGSPLQRIGSEAAILTNVLS